MVGEDPPLLTAREIPTLVDTPGRLPAVLSTVMPAGSPAGSTRPTSAGSSLPSWSGSPAPASLCRTWTPISTRICGRPVAGALLDLAREHGIPAVRTPRSQRLLPVGFGVNLLGRRLRERVAADRLTTTD